MTTDTAMHEHKTAVLVEGPAWGDAQFYGEWLLNAAKANELLKQARRDDPSFNKAVETLEVIYCLDFGISATVYLWKLANEGKYTFVVDPCDQDLIDFALMVDMGFFTLTECRYQITIPCGLDLQNVKRAHLKLVETEDDEWNHPERHILLVAHEELKEARRQLHEMNQSKRLRQRLVFLSTRQGISLRMNAGN